MALSFLCFRQFLVLKKEQYEQVEHPRKNTY